MIEIHKVSKSFGDQTVLREVSATFHPGKVNFIIGRSGSGKSVLTKCTVGLLEPDQGHVTYDGRNFTAMDRQGRKAVRQEIGMLFQGSALFDSMTVAENVMFPLRMFSDATEEEMRDALRFASNAWNCPRRGQVPLGTQRRHAEARGHRPRHCDEPQVPLLRRTQLGAGSPNRHRHRQPHRRFDP